MAKSSGQSRNTQRHLCPRVYRGCRPGRTFAEELMGLPPCVPSLEGSSRHGKEHQYFQHTISYLPAWRTPEMLKRPKSVITTFPLS